MHVTSWQFRLIALLALVVYQLRAQSLTCEPFEGTPSQCTAIFSPTDLVALPPNVSQAELWDASPLRSYLGLLGSASATCRAAADAFLCPASVFPPCDTSFPVPLALRVCRSVCDNMLASCQTEIAQLGQLLTSTGLFPNCSAIDSTTLQPMFPAGNYTEGPSGPVLSCYDPTESASKLTCAEGTVNIDGRCSLKCPNFLQTDRQSKTTRWVCGALTFPSALGFCYALVASILRNGRAVYRWPHSLPLFLYVNGLLVILAYWIGMFSGFERVWCLSNGALATQSHSPCAAQGAIFVFAFYSSAWWIFWLSLNLFLSFTLPKKIPPLLLEVCANATALLVPLVVVIVGLAKNSVRYANDALFCNMTDERGIHMFIYPVTALLYVGSVLLLLLIPIIAFQAAYSAYRNVPTGRCAAMLRFMRTSLRGKWRLLLLAFYTSIGLGVPAGILVYYCANEDKLKQHYFDYFVCINSGQKAADCPRRPLVAWGFQMMAYVLVLLLGTVYALLATDDQSTASVKALLTCSKVDTKSVTVEEWSDSFEDDDVSYVSMHEASSAN